jgi:hypothetical protein
VFAPSLSPIIRPVSGFNASGAAVTWAHRIKPVLGRPKSIAQRVVHALAGVRCKKSVSSELSKRITL